MPSFYKQGASMSDDKPKIVIYRDLAFVIPHADHVAICFCCGQRLTDTGRVQQIDFVVGVLGTVDEPILACYNRECECSENGDAE